MTRREREQIREAMRLFCTDDGFEAAYRILRVLTGGPAETKAERIIREAKFVDVKDVKPGPWKFPTD